LGASTASVWETIAVEAGRESELWAAALRPLPEREEQAVFSPLAESRFAVGLETIYEGYLLHYGRPRLFQADDRDTRILLGDYLYAHGLVRIAALGEVEPVGALAELLSLCAHLRAEALPGDGEAWAATVSALDGNVALDEEARSRALALHAERVE
jgi:hypothetical protein